MIHKPAFPQLLRRAFTQSCVLFLQRSKNIRSFSAAFLKIRRKAAEKPAFLQLLRSFYAELRFIFARVKQNPDDFINFTFSIIISVDSTLISLK